MLRGAPPLHRSRRCSVFVIDATGEMGWQRRPFASSCLRYGLTTDNPSSFYTRVSTFSFSLFTCLTVFRHLLFPRLPFSPGAFSPPNFCFVVFGSFMQSTSLVGAFRNDGANGTLPVLNPAELHQLQVRLSMLLLVGCCIAAVEEELL